MEQRDLKHRRNSSRSGHYEINVNVDERRQLVKLILEDLHHHFGASLVSVVLYGSTARGDCRPDSDIDLLIVCAALPQSKLERIRLAAPVVETVRNNFEHTFHKLAPYISLILKNRTEASYHSPLYLDMLDEAVILFDKHGFIASVFDEMKERLKALGSRRVVIGGKWYWDLKPDYRWGEEFKV